MPFDVEAARKAGYSDDEILQHLTETRKFDVDGAIKAGYSKADIIGHLSTAPAPSAPSVSWLDSVSDFTKGAWSQLNPVAAAKGAWELSNALGNHPIDTTKAILQNQDQVRLKAEDAFKRGEYAEGVRHVLGYLLPIVGPQIDAMGDKAQSGRVAEAMGEAAGFGVANALPGNPAVRAAATKAVTVRVTPKINAVRQAAVDFADRRGIPVPLSVRTGGRFARGLEGLTENDLGGSQYVANARQATTDNLRRVGQELENQAYPTPMSPEKAGAELLQGFQDDIARLHSEADSAYKQAWQIEQDPANVRNVQVGVDKLGRPQVEAMALPIDMRKIKAALKPELERYRYTMTITDQRGSKGLKALENIVEGPDWKPASTAEMDLGALKEAARSEMPELRDTSQGLAANAVARLQRAIDTTVGNAVTPTGVTGSANPALQALKEGRLKTAQKWDIADTAKGFGRKEITELEPVQVFSQLTYRADAGIEKLRDVAAKRPQDLPKVGRAYIEGLLDRATREGSFERAQEILNRWYELGPETKKLLFRSARHVEDLDNFFRLAKMTIATSNPSGTAYTAAISSHLLTLGGGIGFMLAGLPGTGAAGIGAEGARIIGNAGLARLLFSPAGSRAIVRGLQISASAPGAAVLSAEILRLAGKDAKPLEGATVDQQR